MKRRWIPLATILLVGCTPAQINAWRVWFENDPEAAVEFANQPEIQEQLFNRTNPTPGNCDSYVPLFEKYGLPVSTFRAIAWRESGCDHTSFVRDSDDLGGGLLGLNLRAGAGNWFDWCGLTVSNVTDAETNVHCAAEARQRMGMSPWS